MLDEDNRTLEINLENSEDFLPEDMSEFELETEEVVSSDDLSSEQDISSQNGPGNENDVVFPEVNRTEDIVTHADGLEGDSITNIEPVEGLEVEEVPESELRSTSENQETVLDERSNGSDDRWGLGLGLDTERPVIQNYHIYGNPEAVHTGQGSLNYNVENRDEVSNENFQSEKILDGSHNVIGVSELERIESVFVKTNSVRQLEMGNTDQLIVIEGEDGSGRYTTALYWGMKLLKQKRIDRVSSISSNSKGNLASIIKSLPDKTLFVIRDALEAKDSLIWQLIDEKDIKTSNHFKDILSSSSSYIIITITDKQKKDLKNRNKELAKSLFDHKILIPHKPPNHEAVLINYMSIILGGTDAEILLNLCDDFLKTYVKRIRLREIESFVENILKPLDLNLPREDLISAITDKVANEYKISYRFSLLTEGEKDLLFLLCLFEKKPEKDFWYLHSLLYPNANLDKSKDENQEISRWSTLGLYQNESQQENRWSNTVFHKELIQKIGAQLYTPVSRSGMMSNRFIKFIDETYSEEALTFIWDQHPEILIEMIPQLKSLIHKMSENYRIQLAILHAIARISHADWLSVVEYLNIWAQVESKNSRNMVKNFLIHSYANDEIRVKAKILIDSWAKSSDSSKKLIAIWIYQEIRHKDLDHSLKGLTKLVNQLDTSAVLILEPYAEVAQDEEQFYRYIGRKLNINLKSRGLKLESNRAQVEVYYSEVEEAKKRWEESQSVFKGINHAVYVISQDYLKEAIELLELWTQPIRKSENHSSARLTSILIWLNLAKETNKRKIFLAKILELISEDKKVLDSLAFLFAVSFIELYRIQKSDKRWSFELCLVIDEWAKEEAYFDEIKVLFQKVRGYLIDHPNVYRYVTRIFEHRWKSKRMPKQVNHLANLILQN